MYNMQRARVVDEARSAFSHNASVYVELVHIHTCMHTCTYVHMHTHEHTETCTRTQTHSLTHSLTHKHTYSLGVARA